MSVTMFKGVGRLTLTTNVTPWFGSLASQSTTGKAEPQPEDSPTAEPKCQRRSS